MPYSYTDPAGVLAVGIIFPLLSVVAVAARFLVKHTRKLESGLDDWLCLAALPMVCACGVIFMIGVANHTLGNHSPAQDSTDFLLVVHPGQALLMKLEFAYDLLAIFAFGFTKLSILFFYRRIFRGLAFDIVSWTLIAVSVGWTISFFFATVFDCGTNIERNWGNVLDVQTKCINNFKLYLDLAITDVVVDVLILLTPIPWIWTLHLPTHRKIGINFVFLLGSLACAAGIVRLAFFIQILAPDLLSNLDSTVLGLPATDGMGIVTIAMFWPMVQMGFALIACCLPTLRPMAAGKEVGGWIWRAVGRHSERESGEEEASGNGSWNTGGVRSPVVGMSGSGSQDEYMLQVVRDNRAVDRDSMKFERSCGYVLDEEVVEMGMVVVVHDASEYETDRSEGSETLGRNSSVRNVERTIEKIMHDFDG